MNKRILIFIKLFISLALLSGCYDIKSLPSDYSGKKVLTVYHPFPGYSNDAPDFLLQAKKQYEQENENCIIELKSRNESGSRPYLDLEIKEKEKMDVIICGDANLFRFAHMDFAIPMDRFIRREYLYFKEIYRRGLIDEALIDEKIYGLPISMKVQGLLYNKKILDKHDIKISSDWKWDDFLKICKKASRTDKLFLRYKVIHGGNYLTFIEPYLNSCGIPLFEPGLKECNLANAETLKWYSFEKGLFDLDAFYETHSTVLTSEFGTRPLRDLNDGSFTFLPSSISPFDYNLFKYDITNLDFINYPMESEDGFYRSSTIYAFIPAVCEDAENSFKFLKLLASEKIQSVPNQEGISPINKNAFQSIIKQIPEEKAGILYSMINKSRIFIDNYKTLKERRDLGSDSIALRISSNKDISTSYLQEVNMKIERRLKE